MQRMSDMLTRWLEGATRQAEQRQREAAQQGEGQQAEQREEDPSLEELGHSAQNEERNNQEGSTADQTNADSRGQSRNLEEEEGSSVGDATKDPAAPRDSQATDQNNTDGDCKAGQSSEETTAAQMSRTTEQDTRLMGGAYASVASDNEMSSSPTLDAMLEYQPEKSSPSGEMGRGSRKDSLDEAPVAEGESLTAEPLLTDAIFKNLTLESDANSSSCSDKVDESFSACITDKTDPVQLLPGHRKQPDEGASVDSLENKGDLHSDARKPECKTQNTESTSAIEDKSQVEQTEGARKADSSADSPEGAGKSDSSVDSPEGARKADSSVHTPEGARKADTSVRTPLVAIDPVVSLQYHSKGTSSSTIKVDYSANSSQCGPNLPPDLHSFPTLRQDRHTSERCVAKCDLLPPYEEAPESEHLPAKINSRRIPQIHIADNKTGGKLTGHRDTKREPLRGAPAEVPGVCEHLSCDETAADREALPPAGPDHADKACSLPTPAIEVSSEVKAHPETSKTEEQSPCPAVTAVELGTAEGVKLTRSASEPGKLTPGASAEEETGRLSADAEIPGEEASRPVAPAAGMSETQENKSEGDAAPKRLPGTPRPGQKVPLLFSD